MSAIEIKRNGYLSIMKNNERNISISGINGNNMSINGMA
jgi:hypothetical protein